VTEVEEVGRADAGGAGRDAEGMLDMMEAEVGSSNGADSKDPVAVAVETSEGERRRSSVGSDVSVGRSAGMSSSTGLCGGFSAFSDVEVGSAGGAGRGSVGSMGSGRFGGMANLCITMSCTSTQIYNRLHTSEAAVKKASSRSRMPRNSSYRFAVCL
jgi:hypothetical protein